MPWAATVATAAPATPHLGKGPTPKMSTGSSTMLAPRPTAMAKKGVRLLPVALMRATST